MKSRRLEKRHELYQATVYYAVNKALAALDFKLIL